MRSPGLYAFLSNCIYIFLLWKFFSINFHHGINHLGRTKQGRKIKSYNQEQKKFQVHMVKIRANLCYLAIEIKQNFN